MIDVRNVEIFEVTLDFGNVVTLRDLEQFCEALRSGGADGNQQVRAAVIAGVVYLRATREVKK